MLLSAIYGFIVLPEGAGNWRDIRETLIKAFPAPDLRCEAAVSPCIQSNISSSIVMNPCASTGGSKEILN